MSESKPTALHSGTSLVVENCQICGGTDLEPILFLGNLPPVNTMPVIGERPREQAGYPAELLRCSHCELVQLGLVVDARILFPPEYPYTSGTTKILHTNFADLAAECRAEFGLAKDDLVVDVGSNDGTLLSKFADEQQVQGVTPEEVGRTAIAKGVPTIISFFNSDVANRIRNERGPAKVITATNVFAHMEHVHDVVDAILELLDEDGLFISESHYLLPLVETLQYDTVYHEHLRYYTLTSLRYLLNEHGLEIVHAKRIPTHGGSIRVYAARKGSRPVRESVAAILEEEQDALTPEKFDEFRGRVLQSKLDLMAMLGEIKAAGKRVYGVGAPSRASTLVNYVALDDQIIDCVLEIGGSHKIGKYMPGTLIPVREESCVFEEQPEYLLLFSWHIAEELMPKIVAKGYEGDFLIPLPTPHVVKNADVRTRAAA